MLPRPDLLSFLLLSGITCACAFSISDRKGSQFRRAEDLRNSRQSFQAAGSNHRTDSFWSTGKDKFGKDEDADDSQMTDSSAFLDNDKRGTKKYNDRRSSTDSFFDSRNYVDDGNGRFRENAKRSRRKEIFRNRKEGQHRSYYSGTVIGPKVNKNDKGKRRFENWSKHRNSDDSLNMGRFQYDGTTGRNAYDRGNMENSNRFGYRRQDLNYDYPYDSGFGEEQIYYYYYDPDVDALSLGFNSHNHHQIDDDNQIEDNMMMYDDDDDDANDEDDDRSGTGKRVNKKYGRLFETTNIPSSSDIDSEEDNDSVTNDVVKSSTSEEENTSNETEDKNEETNVIKDEAEEVRIQEKEQTEEIKKEEKSPKMKRLKIEEQKMQKGEKQKQNKQQKEHKDQRLEQDKEKNIELNMTPMSTDPNVQTKFTNKQTDDKDQEKRIEESLQNEVEDYQHLKPDIIAYRSDVSNISQHDTQQSNHTGTGVTSNDSTSPQTSDKPTTNLEPIKRSNALNSSDLHTVAKAKNETQEVSEKENTTSIVSDSVVSNQKVKSPVKTELQSSHTDSQPSQDRQVNFTDRNVSSAGPDSSVTAPETITSKEKIPTQTKTFTKKDVKETKAINEVAAATTTKKPIIDNLLPEDLQRDSESSQAIGNSETLQSNNSTAIPNPSKQSNSTIKNTVETATIFTPSNVEKKNDNETHVTRPADENAKSDLHTAVVQQQSPETTTSTKNLVQTSSISSNDSLSSSDQPATMPNASNTALDHNSASLESSINTTTTQTPVSTSDLKDVQEPTTSNPSISTFIKLNQSSDNETEIKNNVPNTFSATTKSLNTTDETRTSDELQESVSNTDFSKSINETEPRDVTSGLSQPQDVIDPITKIANDTKGDIQNVDNILKTSQNKTLLSRTSNKPITRLTKEDQSEKGINSPASITDKQSEENTLNRESDEPLEPLTKEKELTNRTSNPNNVTNVNNSNTQSTLSSADIDLQHNVNSFLQGLLSLSNTTSNKDKDDPVDKINQTSNETRLANVSISPYKASIPKIVLSFIDEQKENKTYVMENASTNTSPQQNHSSTAQQVIIDMSNGSKSSSTEKTISLESNVTINSSSLDKNQTDEIIQKENAIDLTESKAQKTIDQVVSDTNVTEINKTINRESKDLNNDNETVNISIQNSTSVNSVDESTQNIGLLSSNANETETKPLSVSVAAASKTAHHQNALQLNRTMLTLLSKKAEEILNISQSLSMNDSLSAISAKNSSSTKEPVDEISSEPTSEKPAKNLDTSSEPILRPKHIESTIAPNASDTSGNNIHALNNNTQTQSKSMSLAPSLQNDTVESQNSSSQQVTARPMDITTTKSTSETKDEVQNFTEEAQNVTSHSSGVANASVTAESGRAVNATPTAPAGLNDTDYEEIEIPEVSAYMIQDFSLRKEDHVASEQPAKADDLIPSQESGDGNSTTTTPTSNTSGGCPPSVPPAPCPPLPPPAPPRSQAAVSAVLTSHFGPTKEQMIPFDLELLDLADNYDNTTGMFICTIPGTYVISLYLMSHPGAKVNARVFINNRPVAALWADDTKKAGFYPSSSIQTVVQLGFGDQVYVMLVDGGYGDSWVHANYNVFTIFLLYEQVFK